MVSGSSPLARGGRPVGRRLADDLGLIPARAGRTLLRWSCRRRAWAHPRSRGADTTPAITARRCAGSSPLARGGRHPPLGRNHREGLIPARAGRTVTSARNGQVGRAHPRSRGADARASRWRGRWRGSSPLARGGPSPADPRGARAGLIPARAGRTVADSTTPASCGAHPRSRGADPERVPESVPMGGSSPLARGGLARRSRRAVRVGLIPARAGRTKRPAGRRPTTGAHPRSRGADPDARGRRERCRGSSPLARGGPMVERRRQARRGLIPARAGRTSSAWVYPGRRRAHPRSRGADHVWITTSKDAEGSSPLARGGQVRGYLGQAASGLIPARAGRTVVIRCAASCRRAHPRSRGADTRHGSLATFRAGSSPLARGGPRHPVPRSHSRGLIPARAGRTYTKTVETGSDWAHPRSRGADTQRSLYFQGLSSCGAKITFTFEHGDTVQLC